MPERKFQRWHRSDRLALVALLLFVLAGHWDEVLGIRQPVGGDKTSFFFGLMAYYSECLGSEMLPWWNSRWGFGFAGVAESQTGVFYPPNLALYSLLPVFEAFRCDFLLHRFLTAILAYVSFRGLGLGAAGAWMAAMVYIGGGFARVHLDHFWAVRSTAWLPLALWATHAWLTQSRRSALFLLPIVIVVQLLIGHFQIAFMTNVTVLVYGVGASAFSGRWCWSRLSSWLIAVVCGFGLAAIQLAPTFELARYISATGGMERGLEYLSTHAFPPWMLAAYLFPYLYFREPLWRDAVWTPARTAPEECLVYIGIVPLALAIIGAWRWHRHGVIRTWLLLLVVSSWFSFGPFVPGFGWLTQLPGFSFFRAAARWTLIQHFVLGFLAGWVMDRFPTSRMLSRARTAGVAFMLAVAILTALWWYGFASAANARRTDSVPAIAKSVLRWTLPWWNGTNHEEIVRAMTEAKVPDGYTLESWAHTGRPNVPSKLIDQWGSVVRLEIVPSVIGVVLFALAFRRKRALLFGITLVDLLAFTLLFPDSKANVDRLDRKGPSTTALRQVAENARVVGPGGNLLMAAGVAPIYSYRTLDVAWPDWLQRAAQAAGRSILERSAPASADSRLVDLRAIVYENDELNRWIYGDTVADWLHGARATQVVATSFVETTGAVLLPSGAFAPVQRISGGMEFGLINRQSVAKAAGVAEKQGSSNRTRTWRVTVTEPAVLAVGELFLPGWTAVITDAAGRQTIVEVGRLDGYFQAVALSEPGEFTITFIYEPPGARMGMAITAASMICWITILLFGFGRAKLLLSRGGK